jgi:hypothetical protein
MKRQAPTPDNTELDSAKMDSIIGLFDKILNIEESTNKEESEQLVVKISTEIVKYDPELEWNKLNNNLNKLNYFKTVLSKINKFNKVFFDKAFSKFMDKIDEVNQYYLKMICFDVNSYNDSNGFTIYDIDTVREMVLLINESLNNSLNCNELIVKLDYVLKAYSNLVLLASDVRETVLNENKRPRIF